MLHLSLCIEKLSIRMIEKFNRSKYLVLLILVAFLHFAYPLSINENPLYAIVYQTVYTMMVVTGIWLGQENKTLMWSTIILGGIWLVVGVSYALDPTNMIKVLLTYITIFPFQLIVLYLLLRAIFQAERITKDVLYAAITAYILIAAVFVAIYGMIVTIAPHAIIDNAYPDQTIIWQQIIYFSLTTLTTTGYGDILPVGPWARAFANLESVIGVLYLAILMARLVSLYSTEE